MTRLPSPLPPSAARPHARAAARLLAAAGLLAAAATLASLAGGCARTRVAEGLTTDYPADDLGAELAFWHNLPARSAVSNDAALHALLLLADGKDEAKGYPDRVAAAQQRGWLPAGFDEPADLAAQRGRVAVAVAKILELRGGVMMQLLGPTPRYATRELVAMGLLPSASSELQAISGIELLAVVGRAQDVLTARRTAADAAANASAGTPAPGPAQPPPATSPTDGPSTGPSTGPSNGPRPAPIEIKPLPPGDRPASPPAPAGSAGAP